MRWTRVAACAGALLLSGLTMCSAETCPAGTNQQAQRCVKIDTERRDLLAELDDAGASAGPGETCAKDEHCRNDATCDLPDICQGTRAIARCERQVCENRTFVDDDSGCTKNTVANECGAYKAVFCNGDEDQPTPQCSVRCSGDADCDPTAKCIDAECVELGTQPEGKPCTTNEQCATKHCMNGLCCASGDCCDRPTDCPARYTMQPMCTTLATCQGTRGEPICDHKICGTQSVDDDTACNASMIARLCQGAPNIACTGQQSQSPPPQCPAPPPMPTMPMMMR